MISEERLKQAVHEAAEALDRSLPDPEACTYEPSPEFKGPDAGPHPGDGGEAGAQRAPPQAGPPGGLPGHRRGGLRRLLPGQQRPGAGGPVGLDPGFL